MFVPWAAFLRTSNGEQRIFEQPELVDLLRGQSRENPDQIDLDAAIQEMAEAETKELVTPEVE
jgi:hypothetical protein